MKRALAAAQLPLAAGAAYYAGLLLLAALAKPRPAGPAPGRLRFAIVVPAHDEEGVLKGTLESLAALDYLPQRREIVVVADNCTDGTAELARAAGATVLERNHPDLRGKGHALAWAFEILLRERPDVDAFAVIDADCLPTPNLLRAFESRLAAGAAAVQAEYAVGNPRESWSSALRFAAFALHHSVRPRAKGALGFSSGLFGTGMAFSRSLLERLPWQEASLAEDADYHCRLVAAGERVAFAYEAGVTSAMPVSLAQAQEQQLRWEGGRLELIRAWSWRLLRSGLAQRDPARIQAAIEPAIPPQTLLVGGTALIGALAVMFQARAALRLAALTMMLQTVYVAGGMAFVRAPAAVWRALAAAPVLVAWKVVLYARIALRRGPRGWVRTERAPSSPG